MEIEKGKTNHIKKQEISPQDNDGNNSDREDYKKIKKDIKIKSTGKKIKNIGQTLERLLKKNTSKYIIFKPFKKRMLILS